MENKYSAVKNNYRMNNKQLIVANNINRVKCSCRVGPKLFLGDARNGA